MNYRKMQQFRIPWISNTQLFFVMVIIRNTIATSLTSALTSGDAGQDVWISTIISTLLSLVQLWFLIAIHKRLPHCNLTELCHEIFGKYLGKVLSVIFIVYFLALAIGINAFLGLMHMAVLPETPMKAVQWAFLFVVWYSLYKGLHSTIRATGIIFFTILLNHIALLLFLIPEIDLQEFLPVLYYGWVPVLKGVVLPTALFLENLFILQILPMVKKTKWTYRIPYLANIASGALLLSLAGMLVATFGAKEAEKLQFPFFSLARVVSVGNFLERIEIVVVWVWIASIFIGVAVYLFIAKDMMEHTFLWLKSYEQYISIIAVVFVALVTPFFFSNIGELLRFYSDKQYAVLSYIVGLILPAMMYLVMRLRGKGVSS